MENTKWVKANTDRHGANTPCSSSKLVKGGQSVQQARQVVFEYIEVFYSVSGVMQRLATEHLLIALLSSMPLGNYLQHNPQLARPLNRIDH